MVRVVTVSDRNDHRLHRGKPDWESPGKMLNQHAEETLRRAGHGAVQHYGNMLLVVVANINQVKPGRLNEIHLDR